MPVPAMRDDLIVVPHMADKLRVTLLKSILLVLGIRAIAQHLHVGDKQGALYDVGTAQVGTLVQCMKNPCSASVAGSEIRIDKRQQQASNS